MIREIHREDRAALLALYEELHPAEAESPDATRLEAVWTEILANERIQYFIAEIDGVLAASCHLVVVPNLTRGARPYGVIENVVTRADYRRRGLGSAVLQHALGCAWEVDCYKVLLMSGRKTEAVRRFYRRNGFDPDLKQAFVAKPPPRGRSSRSG